MGNTATHAAAHAATPIERTPNIGANLAAMGASAQLATRMPAPPATVFFAGFSLTLQMLLSYERYARYLKWLTLVLLSYVAVLFVVHVDWVAAAKGLVLPSFPLTGDSFTVIVAILGTTISPYLFFWQTAEEVEDMELHHKPDLKHTTPAAARLQLPARGGGVPARSARRLRAAHRGAVGAPDQAQREAP